MEIIRNHIRTPSGADQTLVKEGERYFIVSSVFAPFSGFETLVFEADENGKITDWGDIAGGRGMSQEEAIASLAEFLGGEVIEGTAIEVIPEARRIS